MRNTLDSFYVMYLITAGEVSDHRAVEDLVQLREWHTLPVKLHVVSLARTKSTDSLEKTFSEVNATRGWSQFMIYVGFEHLLPACVHSLPSDIEKVAFLRQCDLSKANHNS